MAVAALPCFAPSARAAQHAGPRTPPSASIMVTASQRRRPAPPPSALARCATLRSAPGLRAFGGAQEGAAARRVEHGRVRAAEEEADTGARTKEVAEHSAFVNEELLLFFFKVDLGTRLQRALNLERNDDVLALRAKITEVEAAIERHQEQKTGGAPTSEAELTDATALGLQLRSELQRAIEDEDYAEAAVIRDKLQAVEKDSLVAALSAQAASSRSKNVLYRLGQRIVHKDDKWVGIICGWDPCCCESAEWMAGRASLDRLANGSQQPFYQVLVGVEATGAYDVAYIPQERLLPFEDMVSESDEEPSEIQHPYTYLLFFGMDKKGNYIPTRALREKYKAQRYIDPALMVDEAEDSDDGNGKVGSAAPDGGDDGPVV